MEKYVSKCKHILHIKDDDSNEHFLEIDTLVGFFFTLREKKSLETLFSIKGNMIEYDQNMARWALRNRPLFYVF